MSARASGDIVSEIEQKHNFPYLKNRVLVACACMLAQIGVAVVKRGGASGGWKKRVVACPRSQLKAPNLSS